jgi:DNA-binding LytR/AlgR family response regulator
MKIKTIIVDDEPMARGVLRKHLEKLQNYELVAECANAIEAINVLQNQAVDVMFLDIQMPELTGLDFLKTLRNPPLVVLATAYSEFGVDSYEFENVVDYILKPINFERFLKTSNRIFERLKTNTQVNETINEEPEPQSENDSIYLKSDKKIYKVNLSEILFLQAYGNYVKVFTEKQGMILVLQKIQEFEDSLPTKFFVRTHKSYIVALNKIKYIEGNQLFIANTCIPIGVTYRKMVKV